MTNKVLIVEDNELNMKLFRDLLNVHGYETIETREGEEVLSLVREHRPDLVVMDIQLPQISGLDIIREIKADKELSGIPIMAVTAFAMRGDEARIRESGCEAYVSKPISVPEFLETVRRILE